MNWFVSGELLCVHSSPVMFRRLVFLGFLLLDLLVLSGCGVSSFCCLSSLTFDLLLSDCGGTLSGERGSFSSPFFPANYPPKADCSWTVQVSPAAPPVRFFQD